MVRVLEQLSCEKWLRELGLFSLEKALGRSRCGLAVLEGSVYRGGIAVSRCYLDQSMSVTGRGSRLLFPLAPSV